MEVGERSLAAAAMEAWMSFLSSPVPSSGMEGMEGRQPMFFSPTLAGGRGEPEETTGGEGEMKREEGGGRESEKRTDVILIPIHPYQLGMDSG